MSLLISLVIALSIAPVAASSSAGTAADVRGTAVSLDVPYLPQSEALCGGAAAAMLFRYWGDTHAGPEQFASIVDRRAGGIPNGVLVDAIRQRGWEAAPVSGSIDMLREQIGRKRPVIILLEDRPARYHYVVVTGVEADAVLVHDPSWGPSRRWSITDVVRAWRPAGFWALVVLPSERRSALLEAAPETVSPVVRSACDVWLDEAVGRVRARGFGAAENAFGEVRTRCPDMAGPLRELAGVRFAQRRWADAADLAGQALARDPHDTYAWEVLASSRFVQDDPAGALRAWNQIGKPRVDTLDITGLQHARYELIAAALGLAPNTILTPDALARTARRLEELPDRASARIAYRPVEDGRAAVEVAIAERAGRPHGAVEWSTTVAKSLVDREVDVRVPGVTGQGELWSASWRWWGNRPRVMVAFATPHAGVLPGVWRVEGSWESQRYVSGGATAFVTETRAHGGLTISDWLTGAVRYGVSAGVDEWNGERRTASIGASLARRFSGDRVSIATDVAAYMPISQGATFRAASIRADATTSTAATGWVLATTVGATGVTADAPLALWPGAGDGHARPALLRAHPLLDGGDIGGPALGRSLVHASGEVQRWIDRASPIRVGIAGFTDAARATRRLPLAAGAPWHVDAGVGLRVKMPGADGTLRADVGRGIRDGAMAFTLGWQY